MLLFLLSLAQDTPVIRDGVWLVQVNAEVRQGNRVVDGLTHDSFQVADNGKDQPIVSFGHDEEPLDVMLLFDTRENMGAAVKRAADAADSALRELRPGDRLAVMAFDCRTDLIADFNGDFTATERAIRERVLAREFKARPGSCGILGPLGDAARHFQKQRAAFHRRRALVVITHDQGMGTKPAAAREMVNGLWAADLVVLGLIVPAAGMHFHIGPPYRGARYAAEKTGGDTLATGQAADGLQEMIRRLRSRYCLYYHLPQGKPGERRKIRVKLGGQAAKRYPGATVRARAGYVMPAH